MLNVTPAAATGELGFLRGAELQREVERLSYRERHTFCIQAAVTMVTYSHRGEVTALITCHIATTMTHACIHVHMPADAHVRPGLHGNLHSLH